MIFRACTPRGWGNQPRAGGATPRGVKREPASLPWLGVAGPGRRASSGNDARTISGRTRWGVAAGSSARARVARLAQTGELGVVVLQPVVWLRWVPCDVTRIGRQRRARERVVNVQLAARPTAGDRVGAWHTVRPRVREAAGTVLIDGRCSDLSQLDVAASKRAADSWARAGMSVHSGPSLYRCELGKRVRCVVVGCDMAALGQ